MKYIKLFILLIACTQTSVFCSLQKLGRAMTRFTSNSSQRMRCFANARPLTSLTIGTSTYIAVALCIGKHFERRTQANKALIQELTKATEEFSQATKQLHEKWQAEEAAKLKQKKSEETAKREQQEKINAKVSQRMKDAYIETLARLANTRNSEGQEPFLKKAAAFAAINGLTIEQVKESFSANRDLIAAYADASLKQLRDNPNINQRELQENVNSLNEKIPHIQLLDIMIKELEELSAANTAPAATQTK